jgi:hypothetical protein
MERDDPEKGCLKTDCRGGQGPPTAVVPRRRRRRRRRRRKKKKNLMIISFLRSDSSYNKTYKCVTYRSQSVFI